MHEPVARELVRLSSEDASCGQRSKASPLKGAAMQLNSTLSVSTPEYTKCRRHDRHVRSKHPLLQWGGLFGASRGYAAISAERPEATPHDSGAVETNSSSLLRTAILKQSDECSEEPTMTRAGAERYGLATLLTVQPRPLRPVSQPNASSTSSSTISRSGRS